MVYNLVFIMKMTVYTIWLVCLKGRASAVSFYGWGFWVDVVNLKHSVRYESLVVSNSRNQTSPKPIIYVVIWIYFYDGWSTVNLITVHEPIVSLAFTALPRITADYQHNINIEQPLLLSLKPRLILYSNESCHTSRADTICAVSL